MVDLNSSDHTQVMFTCQDYTLLSENKLQCPTTLTQAPHLPTPTLGYTLSISMIPTKCSLLSCMSVTWCWCSSLCSLHSWISLDITTRTLVPRREMFTFPFTNSWWPLGIHLFVTPPNSISKILGHKLMSLVAIGNLKREFNPFTSISIVTIMASIN